MRFLLTSFLMIGFCSLTGCSTEPVPIEFGKDICHHCKMTAMDNKYGAELVTRKGKIYKFDDVNCFLNFYNSGVEEERNIKHRLVIDYSNPGHLIDAGNAFYLKSRNLRTPMNSEVAAFETKSKMDSFKREWNGIYLGWGEVVTQFK